MSGNLKTKPEPVIAADDGDEIASPSSDRDPEKTQSGSGTNTSRIGDQIPHKMLEELAPNGEGEYILEKVNNMTEEEALAIIQESLVFHSDDWNFPSEMRERMKRLLELGPKGYGEFYDRDLRIDATMMRYSSPYPGVRAVADPFDDSTIPIETIRAYFLGIAWAVIGTFMSTFFNSRFPAIGLNGNVIQILLYPCAKFLVWALPDWGVTVFGVRHSLNPGPWTFKEQMFATITYNIAIYTTNSYGMILVQKLDVYYGLHYVTFGYQLMLTLFVQLMGMGFAGYLRRFSVYPVKALWPTILPKIAMNRALTRPEPKENIYGWTISRYKFFYLCTLGMFFYYWLPGYLFTALATFNWMTWIAPENLTLAILTGSNLGLGLFNPITTFDWNIATSSYDALALPFFSTCTQYFGGILGGLIILGIYYSNMNYSAYLPINSSSAFANDGKPYVVQKVVVNNKLDEKLYQSYSPPFYSAGYILTVGANFAFYPVYFLYIMVNQWATVGKAYVDFYKGLRYGKGNYEGAMDVHSRLMAKYPEVPDWWFLVILVGAIVVSVIFLEIYPLDTPVWLVFLMIGINLVFAVPLSFLSATTGTNLGLGALIQVITGFILPGNPNAFLFSQTLGSWALAGYGDNYVQDQKMAHYVKIPPRSVFRSQIGTIIITCFVAVATQNFILENVKGLCTPTQPSRFTCANDGNPLYASSLMWGLLGSRRMFDSLYPLFKWCFLIGTGIALLFLFGQGYGPKYLPSFRDKVIKPRLSQRSFAFLDRTVFRLVASLLWLNPILIIQGIQHWAPSNMSYKTPGFILSCIFMYWLPRHRLAWWEKYNYVLSAALTAGVAISALVMFFAVGYNPVKLDWWGNKVSWTGIDGRGTAGILEIPKERGYFGPERGSFP
ncbi:OPT domain containing protein [Rhypophila sp. PSN 637]